MLSDWIVGTGEGRVGDVDATVRRDGDGLPFVPAKTLTGIWRDACEQVAGWLGAASGHAVNPWQGWVDWIFGSQSDVATDPARMAHRAPRPAALAVSPARLPRMLHDACRGRPALLAAAVVLRPGVKIDDETGVASDDMLRVEERARPETLEAWVEFPLLGNADIPVPAEFLLRAGAAVIDGLGGKRNRGAGTCWLLLPGASVPSGEAPAPATHRPPDERLAGLAADMAMLDAPGLPPEHQQPGPRLAIPTATTGEPRTDGQVTTSANGSRTVWRVTFEVITPLIAQHRVLGNVVLSHDRLPGSVLLPVVLGHVDRPLGHHEVVVGDARPAAASGGNVVPGLPVPMTWYRHKDRHRTNVVNAAVRHPDPAERLKPMRSGHVVPASEEAWFLLEPQMSVSTHAVIDDDAGRPDDNRGGVFTYLGIAPGTVLVSDIVLPKDAGFSMAPGERLRLGRSRKDDFGEVEVRDVQPVPPLDVAAVAEGATIRVWCVSDVLLRDDRGTFDPSPQALARELSRRLGVRFSVTPGTLGGPVTQAFRAARRDSFHTRWGRPRPSLVGMSAGSVVTLTAAGPVTADALIEIQRDGIGERTAEGFGQVRFDAPEMTVRAPGLVPAEPVAASHDASTPQTTTSPAVPDAALPAAPHVLERAAVMAEITRQVALIVAEGVNRVIPGASEVSSRSQWGSLREQLPRLRTPGGRAEVNRWLEQTLNVRQRRNAWGEDTLKAIKQLLTDDAEIWIKLGLAGSALDEFVLAPGRADQVRSARWASAVSVLITEIARHSTRRLQAAMTGEAEA